MWAFFGFGRPHIHIFWVFNGKIIDIADRLVQKGKKRNADRESICLWFIKATWYSDPQHCLAYADHVLCPLIFQLKQVHGPELINLILKLENSLPILWLLIVAYNFLFLIHLPIQLSQSEQLKSNGLERSKTVGSDIKSLDEREELLQQIRSKVLLNMETIVLA
jgi:hypothetical protein